MKGKLVQGHQSAWHSQGLNPRNLTQKSNHKPQIHRGDRVKTEGVKVFSKKTIISVSAKKTSVWNYFVHFCIHLNTRIWKQNKILHILGYLFVFDIQTGAYIYITPSVTLYAELTLQICQQVLFFVNISITL